MATNVLRTGLVIAGGYADKVRRVLFAQLRDRIKSGELSNQEVARAAGELNRLLYEIIVNKLRLDKGDVVRITVEYDVDNGSISFKLDTLSIEAWRRVPEEEIKPHIAFVVEHRADLIEAQMNVDLRRLGETDTGDVVFEVTLNGKPVGILLVTPLDGKAVVRGALSEPTPLKIPKTIIDLEGDLENSLSEKIRDLVERGQNVEKREADRIVYEIRSMIEAAALESEESFNE